MKARQKKIRNWRPPETIRKVATLLRKQGDELITREKKIRRKNT